MKIKSLRVILDDALKTLTRFPFAILSAVLATITMIMIIELRHGEHETLTKLTMVAYLGISFLSGIGILIEKKDGKKEFSILFGICSLILLAVYYFTIEVSPVNYFRLSLFLIASHLFVAISQSFANKDTDEFWLFNKTIMLRILLGAFYTLVLFSGLSLAILALKTLFHVKFNDDIYSELFIFLSGVFNTIFFLSGVPDSNSMEKLKTPYPKSLKIFVQYILFPIAALYLVILYSYLLKIIFTWQLPNGWVSSLVIAYSIVGILAFLLIYPLRNEEGIKWIKYYSRWFFITLIPLLGLMSVAVYVRINEYGITESRYFGIITNLWLYGISIYFIISKKQLLKSIPVSLLIVSILIAVGPWSAMSVSERYQISRFERILKDSKKLINGKINVSQEMSWENLDNAKSILKYMESIHKFKGFKVWLKENTDFSKTMKTDSITENYIIEKFGLKTSEKAKNKDLQNARRFTFELENLDDKAIPVKEIKDYDYYFKYSYSNYSSTNYYEYKINELGISYAVYYNPSDSVLKIYVKEKPNCIIKLKLSELEKSLLWKVKFSNNLSYKDALIKNENEKLSTAVIINYMNWHNYNSDNMELSSMNAFIYVKLK